jgi:hypothetical protein
MPILQLKPQWELGAPPQTVSKQIPNNDQGNFQTVKEMITDAHRCMRLPLVRSLALKIIEQAGIQSHDFLEECRALAEFVQKYVRYVRDPTGIEQLHSPLYMIDKIKAGVAQGDCDDQALLLAALLLSVGAQPFFAIVRYRSTTGPFNHIYTVVYEKNWGQPKERLVLDTILKDKDIGFEVPFKSIMEIPV